MFHTRPVLRIDTARQQWVVAWQHRSYADPLGFRHLHRCRAAYLSFGNSQARIRLDPGLRSLLQFKSPELELGKLLDIEASSQEHQRSEHQQGEVAGLHRL